MNKRALIKKILAQLTAEQGGPAELVAAIRTANTARHVQELVDAAGFSLFYARLCELAAEQCVMAMSKVIQLEVVLFDFNGRILGRAER